MPSIIDYLLGVGGGAMEDAGDFYDSNIAPGFRGVGELFNLAGTDGVPAALAEAGSRIGRNLGQTGDRYVAGLNPRFRRVGGGYVNEDSPEQLLRAIAQSMPDGPMMPEGFASSALDAVDRQNQGGVSRAIGDLATKVMSGDKGLEARRAALAPFVPGELKETLGSDMGDAVSAMEMLGQPLPRGEGHARLTNDHLTGGNFSKAAAGTAARQKENLGLNEEEHKKERDLERAYKIKERETRLTMDLETEKELTKEYIKTLGAAGKSPDEIADGLIKFRSKLRGEAPAEESSVPVAAGEQDEGGSWLMPALAVGAAALGGRRAYKAFKGRGGKAVAEAVSKADDVAEAVIPKAASKGTAKAMKEAARAELLGLPAPERLALPEPRKGLPGPQAKLPGKPDSISMGDGSNRERGFMNFGEGDAKDEAKWFGPKEERAQRRKARAEQETSRVEEARRADAERYRREKEAPAKKSGKAIGRDARPGDPFPRSKPVSGDDRLNKLLQQTSERGTAKIEGLEKLERQVTREMEAASKKGDTRKMKKLNAELERIQRLISGK